MLAPLRRDRTSSRIDNVGIFTILTLGCFLVPFLFPSLVTAQDASGLSISPAVFELNGDPEDTITNQVKIYNPTDNPQNVIVDVEDFYPVGEEGQVTFETTEENETYSMAQWTSVSPSEFTLQPKAQKTVTFTINIPKIAEPGGHYGSIVATVAGSVSNAGTTGSAVTSKRGALVLLSVSGTITEEIIVNSFETDKFREYGPVELELKFENTGNVHVRPAGFISITDIFGKQVAELEIPQRNVIPGAIRKVNVDWDKENLIGRYTATVVANYGSAEKQTVTATTVFTVFPWKVTALIGGIVVVFITLFYLGRKRIFRALKILLGKN